MVSDHKRERIEAGIFALSEDAARMSALLQRFDVSGSMTRERSHGLSFAGRGNTI